MSDEMVTAALTGCAPDALTGSRFTPIYGCGTHYIYLQPAAESVFGDELRAALDTWSSALGGGVPHFSFATDAEDADITISVQGTGPKWCGDRFRLDNPIIYTCGVTRATDDLGALLLHEVGHFYGHTDYREDNYAVAGVSDECIMYLGSQPPDDKSVCQHDLELVYAGYGIRSAA